MKFQNAITVVLAIVFLAVFLPACSEQPALQPVEKTLPFGEMLEQEALPKGAPPVAIPTKTVIQKKAGRLVTYGFDDSNNLLVVMSNGSKTAYNYEGGVLVSIEGSQSAEFIYDNGKLVGIRTPEKKLRFEYDGKGRLSILENTEADEKLYFEYDSSDRLRIVRRGASGKISLDYDDRGRVKYITKGNVQTIAEYDDKGRLRDLNADELHLILGYWRDDKLSSLTGKTFGKGETVSYGPDYPPFEAKIISQTDDSVFTSSYTDVLYEAVDFYLYCTKIKVLPVLFDGVSYTIFANYYKEGLVQYFVKDVMCAPLR